MNPTLSLVCDGLRCEIVPGLGAAVAGLWLDDIPVLRSSAGARLASVRDAGSYPLVPFSNRIGHARMQWKGASHTLAQNFPPEPHAIHGVGWQRPWAVMEAQAHFALLAFEHRPDAAWPFAFDCSQAFRLGEDALEMSLSVTNQSWQAAPFGLGWHPYFVKRPHSHLAFSATGRWEMGPDKLPTHRMANAGMDVDCAALDVDHCFDGCSSGVELHDPLLRIRLRSSLQRLVVFTQPVRDFVAIEPVSHVNNALNLVERDPLLRLHELGVEVLEPGQTLSASMRLVVGRRS
jgi:aldose 1-epimerase